MYRAYALRISPFCVIILIYSSMSNRSIAEVNDEFRRGNSDIPGKVMLTQGVASLGDADVQAIMEKVQNFDGFTKDNDPYGEHDFGKIIHNGKSFFFKFDYYDPTLQFHSEDKTDLTKTVRIMTVMFASEY